MKSKELKISLLKYLNYTPFLGCFQISFLPEYYLIIYYKNFLLDCMWNNLYFKKTPKSLLIIKLEMNCIIKKCCSNIAPDELTFSKEHIFPESIGGTITTNEVCSFCNSYLGSNVDKYLTDNFFVASERLFLKLKGKKGYLPNPLKDCVYSEDDSKKIQYLMNDEGKPKQIRTVPFLRTLERDGNKIIEARVDYTEKEKLHDMVNKTLVRNEQQPLSQIEIDKLLERTIIQNPTVTTSFFIDLVNIYRPLLKIIYELCFRWVGNIYTQDETSEIIRICVIDDTLKEDFHKKYPLKGSLNWYPTNKFFPFHVTRENSHLAIMKEDSEKILCAIRIFNVLELAVIVSDNAKQYTLFKPMFLEINPITKETRELCWYDELKNIGEH